MSLVLGQLGVIQLYTETLWVFLGLSPQHPELSESVFAKVKAKEIHTPELLPCFPAFKAIWIVL